MDKEIENQVRSKCCSADFDYFGGGYDGEDIVPIVNVCKECGKKCELIGGKGKAEDLPF